MSDNKPKEIVSRYEKASYYKKVAATGAVGGVTPNGGILVNFFHESQNLPEAVKIKLNADGTHEEVREDHLEYTRELQVGIVLDQNVARSIATWLIERANEAQSLHDGEKSK